VRQGEEWGEERVSQPPVFVSSVRRTSRIWCRFGGKFAFIFVTSRLRVRSNRSDSPLAVYLRVAREGPAVIWRRRALTGGPSLASSTARSLYVISK